MKLDSKSDGTNIDDMHNEVRHALAIIIKNETTHYTPMCHVSFGLTKVLSATSGWGPERERKVRGMRCKLVECWQAKPFLSGSQQ